MRYSNLSHTGMKVSTLSLGTMIFGEKSERSTPEDEAYEIIDHFIGAGGNFIDTANGYADGKSEEIVGKAIQGRRDDVVIATKFRFPEGEGPNKRGPSRKNMYYTVERSLDRLNTDYIDLLYVHGTAPQLPFKELMSSFNHMIEQGKVRYIGVSNFRAWELMNAVAISQQHGWDGFAAAQYQYSLVERNIEKEFANLFEHTNIDLVPWGPLGGGFLTGKYKKSHKKPPEGTRIATMEEDTEESWQNRNRTRNWKIMEVVNEIVEDKGVTHSQVAINWLIQQDIVNSPIIGVRTLEQLQDNLGAVEFELTQDELSRLDEVSKPFLEYPYGFIKKYCED